MLVFTQKNKQRLNPSINPSDVTWSRGLLKGLGLGSTGCLVSCCGADEDHRPSVTQDRIRIQTKKHGPAKETSVATFSQNNNGCWDVYS